MCCKTFLSLPWYACKVIQYGCIYRIRWSLLGSYACFTTTSLATVDTYLLLRLCTTCRYQTTATCWEWELGLELMCVPKSTHQLGNSCTVLCRALNMRLWQVSLAGQSGSLIGHLPWPCMEGKFNWLEDAMKRLHEDDAQCHHQKS